jgi:hypothetical protein
MLAQKLEESTASKRLLGMLRNTLRNYPRAKLLTRREGFGVSLDAEKSLYVSLRGDLTDTEKRDLLALLATWLVADPNALQPALTPLSGYYSTAVEEYKLSRGRAESNSTND